MPTTRSRLAKRILEHIQKLEEQDTQDTTKLEDLLCKYHEHLKSLLASFTNKKLKWWDTHGFHLLESQVIPPGLLTILLEYLQEATEETFPEDLQNSSKGNITGIHQWWIAN